MTGRIGVLLEPFDPVSHDYRRFQTVGRRTDRAESGPRLEGTSVQAAM
jgi:hypothetical protein